MGLERSDDRVSAGVGVGGRVAVWRVVATADMTAFEADPQMKPRLVRGQALLTTRNLVGKLGELDVITVRAGQGRLQL